jgi:alpha-D-xyloside xylohydrolase
MEISLYTKTKTTNYNYETGKYATMPIHWDEAQQSLTIGVRKGDFPGMLATRTFRVVLVRENHGIGLTREDRAEKIVRYSGQTITVQP